MSDTGVPAGKVAAVVTSLEMFAPPASRPAPEGLRLSLRQVEQPAPGWFRALYRKVGENWLWYTRLMMSDAALCAIIHDPRVEVYVLMRDAEEAGLLELDFRIPGECEVSFFGVTQELIGAGAARWLMNHALARAWSRPVRRVWVHTCTFDHPAALAFYLRSGFRPYAREIEIVDDPRLTGVLPRTAAPHIPLIE